MRYGLPEGSVRGRCIDGWNDFTRHWLDDADAPWPEPFERWYASYTGSGDSAPVREAMAEPFIGSWQAPRLVTLGLNPGMADLSFQGRGGRFAAQVRTIEYSAWAATDPYGSDAWERHSTVNRPLKSGLRVNVHRRARVRFARDWLGEERVNGRDVLMLELYPWHSRRWSGAYNAPRDALREFLWEPLGELPVDVIFAFASRWRRIARDLGLRRIDAWGPEHFTAKGRRVETFALPNPGQRLVVVWQPAYAGPPGAEDTQRLRDLLAQAHPDERAAFGLSQSPGDT